MARKIIVTQADGSTPVLTEIPAQDEAQLQTTLKEIPGVLPIEEFGLTGPMMVVGEETPLQSGSVDLLGLTRAGNLIIVEFKTSPQNPDFRRATAQLLDYGSDLWRMSFEEFESSVAVRFFCSERWRDQRAKGSHNLEEAARSTWDDLSDEEWASLSECLAQQLARGAFAYVLAAQRFTDSAKRTLGYLNALSQGPRFYAVESVRFASDSVSAFEFRTILKPPNRLPTPTSRVVDETNFLEGIDDPEYRETLQRLLAAMRGLNLRIEWGSVGCSVRVPTGFRAEPVTVAWLFPPGRPGWMGLTDLTMGFDAWTADRVPKAKPMLDRYVERVGALRGLERTKTQSLDAYYLLPERVITLQAQLIELLVELVRDVDA